MEEESELYRRDLYEQYIQEIHEDKIISSIRKAEKHIMKGEYRYAEWEYKFALAECKDLYVVDCRWAIDALAGLAELHERCERYQEAESYYMRCLVVHEKVFGPAHPSANMFLGRLATLRKKSAFSRRPSFRQDLVIDARTSNTVDHYGDDDRDEMLLNGMQQLLLD